MALIRLLLKLSLLMSVLFALAIGVIRAQPYDDGGLRDFLFNSPGCETIPDNEPCFIGIRPGVTTFDGALAILRHHEWVEHLTAPTTGDWSTVSWTWSGKQSPFIPTQGDAALNTSLNDPITVTHIYMDSTAQAKEFFLLLGLPDGAGYLPRPAGNDPYSRQIFQLYIDPPIQLTTLAPCPLSDVFWTKPMRITWDTELWQRDLSDYTKWDRQLPMLPRELCA
jgi:hypothetical protein